MSRAWVLLRRLSGSLDQTPTIAYDIAGHGPLVMFVHGLTSNRRGWDPVTSQLVQDFACLRVDLRGHGDSSTAAD